MNERLYKIWTNMKQRCTNPNYVRSKDYMGRGITICDEWMKNYQAFEDWSMNNGYSDNLSIDGINNSGNYEPNNCRWTTAEIQANNTRNVKKYEYKGKSLSVSQWAREVGLARATISNRLLRRWSIERALTEPPIDVFKPGWKTDKILKKESSR